MKITHNKIGQNLNLIDGAKTDKADAARGKSGLAETAKADVLAKAGLASSDSTRIDLSPKAQEAKRIKELAKAAPDVDMEKVEKFRQLIDEGKYKVDAKAIADRMIDQELEIL